MAKVPAQSVDVRTFMRQSVAWINNRTRYEIVSSDATLKRRLTFVDSSGGPITVTLPSASTVDIGDDFIIVNTGGSVVTVDGAGSETINGSTTYSLSNQYDSVHLVTDRSEWFVV